MNPASKTEGLGYASRYLHGDPSKVIAFTMACCYLSCDKSLGAVEVPNISPWGA